MWWRRMQLNRTNKYNWIVYLVHSLSGNYMFSVVPVPLAHKQVT